MWSDQSSMTERWSLSSLLEKYLPQLVRLVRHIWKSKIIFFLLAIFFLGILTNSYGQLSFSVLFGFVFGSYCSSVIVYLKTFSDDFGTAYGVYLFVSSLSSIVSPALVGGLKIFGIIHKKYFILGYVYDTWESYRIAYFSLAGTLLVSSLILGLVPLRYQKKKNYLEFESE